MSPAAREGSVSLTITHEFVGDCYPGQAVGFRVDCDSEL